MVTSNRLGKLSAGILNVSEWGKLAFFKTGEKAIAVTEKGDAEGLDRIFICAATRKRPHLKTYYTEKLG